MRRAGTTAVTGPIMTSKPGAPGWSRRASWNSGITTGRLVCRASSSHGWQAWGAGPPRRNQEEFPMNGLFVGLIAGAFGMAYFFFGKLPPKLTPVIFGVGRWL